MQMGPTNQTPTHTPTDQPASHPSTQPTNQPQGRTHLHGFNLVLILLYLLSIRHKLFKYSIYDSLFSAKNALFEPPYQNFIDAKYNPVSERTDLVSTKLNVSFSGTLNLSIRKFTKVKRLKFSILVYMYVCHICVNVILYHY